MKKKFLTNIQKKEIIEKYKEGFSCKKVGKLFNREWNCVRKILIKNGIFLRKSYRKYLINENFFENIDNDKNSYVLGLWCADGCNYEYRNYIIISMIDLDIIKKIRKTLEYNGPIKIIKPNGKSKKTQYRLDIFSKKLSQDLAKWGCVSNKSYQLEFPNNINNGLMKDFIRGIFDGDGCLSQECKTSYWQLTITGTKNICEGIKNYLGYGNSYLNKKNKKNNHITYIWKTRNIKKIKRFLDYIYREATIFLDRKYTKYESFLKYYNEKEKNFVS